MAIGLVVAKLLGRQRSKLRGNVKFVFQPAEEGPGGAKPMIEAGVLASPRVDAAFGLHMWNELPVGHVGIRPGPILAAADEIKIEIRGKGTHGAAPHLGVDPVVAAAQVVTALQTIASRESDPLKSVVITIGSIHGGTRFNIIPDAVELWGTVRTFEPKERKELAGKIERVVRGVTQALGATYKYAYIEHYPPTINDRQMTELATTCAEEVLSPKNIADTLQSMGAEDMSYFLNAVPGCFIFLGSSNKQKGLAEPHHCARFDFDEDALPIGAEILLRIVRKYLQS